MSDLLLPAGLHAECPVCARPTSQLHREEVDVTARPCGCLLEGEVLRRLVQQLMTYAAFADSRRGRLHYR